MKTNMKPHAEPDVKPNVAASLSPVPMFSWCGSASTTDMIFPTYELTEVSGNTTEFDPSLLGRAGRLSKKNSSNGGGADEVDH